MFSFQGGRGGGRGGGGAGGPQRGGSAGGQQRGGRGGGRVQGGYNQGSGDQRYVTLCTNGPHALSPACTDDFLFILI